MKYLDKLLKYVLAENGEHLLAMKWVIFYKNFVKIFFLLKIT